ncbi:hypothetical protein [Geoalkalibacter halelectricus]|uniref:hypothetical protein n=1 Tax=Geoalkalibacter halelectricus TaxID=2847045 RepID=UPI003D220C75
MAVAKNFKRVFLFPLLDVLAWICENFRRFVFWMLMALNAVYAIFYLWPEKGAGVAAFGFLGCWFFIYLLFGDFRRGFPVYIINGRDQD